jgi:tRNA modification GTPase
VASLVGRPHVIVRNKVDLLSGPRVGEGVWTSAVTGEGIDELRTAIVRELQAEGSVGSGAAINTLRQQEAVGASLKALEAAAQATAVGQPHEILLMDLHAALAGLDALTGTTSTEDILGRIFSTFCIGK